MVKPSESSPSLRTKLADVWPKLENIYHKEIWQSAHLKDPTARGRSFAVLRVISITITVFMETRVASRAAALSFSSLLGIGPLIAITVMVAGFALGKNDPIVIANSINQMVKIVVPQIGQYENLSADKRSAAAPGRAEIAPADKPATDEPAASANVTKLVDIIDNIITASRSGSAGALGVFSLILIVLLLFKSIEDAFNDIWGVRLGRSILMRIVFYWTILTLGAVLFFTALALLGASAVVNVFMEKLPGGHELLKVLSWSLPAFSFTLLAVMLAIFYRVIPNTRVFWRPAFIGGFVVAALLMLNNFVAILYVKRVYLEKSLYGSLAIGPVLMLGLYIFWLYVLIGGIVSYAIQNVHFRNSQAAWSTLTETMRERLSLVVFLTVCRRFRECMPPASASDLSTMLKVPTQLLNECVNRLVQLNLITTIRPDPGTNSTDYLYQPARPLNRITLFDFKTLDDNFGENPIGTSLERIDPILHEYTAALNRLGEQTFFQKNLDELFADHPFDESRPPFAMGEHKA